MPAAPLPATTQPFPFSIGRRGMLGLLAGTLAWTAAPSGAVPALGLTSAEPVPDAKALQLWYSRPGSDQSVLTEGLPVGNGRLGALVAGDPSNTVLVVSEATLWTGGPNGTLNSAGQFPYGKNDFGGLQLLARLRVRLPAHSAQAVSDYRRRLDLSNGLVVTTYTVDGTTIRQEVFASAPADVIVCRIVATDGPARLTGTIALEGAHGETSATTGSAVGFAAALGNGLRYAATTAATTAGGSVSASGGTVTFTDAQQVVVVLSASTDYLADAARNFRDAAAAPAAAAQTALRQALDAGGDALLGSHLADYQPLFAGFELGLGSSTPAQRALDTGARLALRKSSGTPDPELEALYVQFARYLAISGSRSGLPIGLQGPWLDSNDSAWFADYHTDINLQMNYWLADRVGLGATYEPLVAYCLAQLPRWEQTTAQLFQDPRNRFRNRSGRVAGWTVAISTNPHGGNGWWWHPAGNAWLCNELFAHYEYTEDRAFLARIMPLLTGACRFWESRLVTATGTLPGTTRQGEVLVADLDWSPEHGPDQRRANSYQQELVHALFTNFSRAAAELGTEAAYARTVERLRDRLYLPEVSPTTGWYQEWNTPENLGEKSHRHLSHLIGFFPGDRLRWDSTPQAVLDAVRNTLVARGNGGYGWATAWRVACWARLRDANRAYELVGVNLAPSVNGRSGTAPNLFDIYDGGIFQIDANFGTPTAMLEMLVSCTGANVDLLPALPAAWSTGSVSGLGVKGGFRLDLQWRDGHPTTVRLTSTGGRTTTVRHGGWQQTVTLSPGASTTLSPPARSTGWTLRNVGTGLLLTVDGGSVADGARLVQAAPDGTGSQRFRIGQQPTDGLTIDNVLSGKRIDVIGGSTAEGAEVGQWAPSSTARNQRFRLLDAGAGRVRLVCLHSGKVLGIAAASTAAGARVVTQTDTAAAHQTWTVTR